MARMKERFWEIDLLRGIAISLMVVFHALYDLKFFGFPGLELGASFWYYSPRLIASLFILLVGVSLSISYSRSVNRAGGKALYRKYLFRGAGIFLWGMVITLVTWVLFPSEYILFGILHLIGVSILLAYPFIRRGYLVPLLGVACIVSGLYLENMSFTFPYLIFLGFTPDTFSSLDFFPLLPWFGLVLMGISLGDTFYKENVRRYALSDLSGNLIVGVFCRAGRHSLAIYLLHQPFIVGVLYLAGLFPSGSFF